MLSKLGPTNKVNLQELRMEQLKSLDYLDVTDVKSLSFDIDQNSYISSEAQHTGPYHSFRKSRCYNLLASVWKKTFGRIGGDWVFLALLGICMAWISLFMEYLIELCVSTRIYLSQLLAENPLLQYFGWICLPVCLILFSTGFTQMLAPQAAGSGIPEMKTISRGIVLKESFTFKALIAKIMGLSATLATGLPVGKEGPYVHIASMVAFLLTKAATSLKGIYENRSRHSDMLAAACAVGVATAYAAPIGGVLFSIEVTAVHFAVRNYWRGFFAAVFATVMHGFLAVWLQRKETIGALFRTNFTADSPFSPQEIFIFAAIGIVCGFLGAIFVWAHRVYCVFKSTNCVMQWIVKKSFLLYPFLVTLLYTSLTFPLGLGMFVAGDKATDRQITGLFSNYSWQKENPTEQEMPYIEDWTNQYAGIFVNLSLYVILSFFGTILASTIPVPAGIFVPVLKIGAALGRIFGEAMYLWYPYGVILGLSTATINPGGYAIVGAAALAGAVTHTVSSSVIAFEMAGDISFCIPVMVAVFFANATAQSMQCSIFDSIIKMKKLPYLPSIATSSSNAYHIYVQDFMVRSVKFIWYGMTYDDLERLLVENKKLRILPLVDSQDSMILLGSVQQKHLIAALASHLSQHKKIPFFKEWKLAAERSLQNEILSSRTTDEKSFEETPKGPRRRASSYTPPVVLNIDGELTCFDAVNKNNELPYVTEGFAASMNFNTRRQSRFAVSKVETPLHHASASTLSSTSSLELPKSTSEIAMSDDDDNADDDDRSDVGHSNDELSENGDDDDSSLRSENLQNTNSYNSRLKKTNSFSSRSKKTYSFNTGMKKSNSVIFGSTKSLSNKSLYATIQAGDSNVLKYTLASVQKAKSLLRLDSNKSSRVTFTSASTSYLPTKTIIERIKEQEVLWEEQEKQKEVDFANIAINPAPHQLDESSSLLQVHSMFSLLEMNHSYVTSIGRLIGVVSLKELRHAVEKANAGD